MRITDVRQLYGPNRLLSGPGVQILADPEGDDPRSVAQLLLERVRALSARLWWPAPRTSWIAKPGFVAVAFSARWLDAAWSLGRAVRRSFDDPDPDDYESLLSACESLLREDIPSEAFLRVVEEAERRDLPWCALSEREALLGYGSRSLRVEKARPVIPDWDRVGRIPIAAVSGTNGKTTCARLLARVYREAGYLVGNTSSDGIQINGAFVFEGDCTGPDSMRDLLADPRVNAVVLEAARGGILRRGLPFDRCDLALITNVTPDHLGLGGVDTLDEMAQVKGVLVQALAPDGAAVLSADDARVAALARPDRRTVYFSREERNPRLAAHRAAGGASVWVEKGVLRAENFSCGPFQLPLADVPITLHGAASHNAENAAAVLAAGLSLGLPADALRRALTQFQPSPEDNPGRTNAFQYRGATVILDFAHNVDGIRTLVETAKRLSAARVLMVIGQAGDRTDELIQQEAASAWEARPSVIVIKETPEQLRGRQPGEVPALFRDAFLALGAPSESLRFAPTELAGVELALSESQPGDVVLLMVHQVRSEALALLRKG